MRVRSEYRVSRPHIGHRGRAAFPNHGVDELPQIADGWALYCPCGCPIASDLRKPVVLAYEQPLTCWNCGRVTVRNAPISWLVRRWYLRHIAPTLRHAVGYILGVPGW